MIDDFDRIISFESLYAAHRKARLGKRHKKEVIEFEMNLSENLWALHNDLKYGKYKVGGYHTFTIYDPKEREIQAIGYRDRIVQHALCDNYLNPLFEKQYIYDNAACRVGKGTHFALARLRYFMEKHYRKYGKSGYFVKFDIKQFFMSISHSIILQKCSKLINDNRIYALITEIINSFAYTEGRGLPMGNQSSQSFALLYLTALDKYIKQVLQIKYYIRYMDDMILIVKNKQIAQKCFICIREFVLSEFLKPNEKSQIISINNGIEFLGWRFKFSASGQILQTIKRQSKQRMLKKYRNILYLYKKSRLSLSAVNASINSFHAHLSYGNAQILRDKFLYPSMFSVVL